MAKNPDFLKVVRKDVEMLWPRLDQTYRYDSQKKATEPCSANVQGAGWSLGIKMSLKDGKALKAELKAHYDDCRTRNSSLPEFFDVFGSKRLTDENGNPTDSVQFTAKKKAVSNAGAENKPPIVVGADRLDLADKAIWSGSVGHVRMLAYPVTDPDGKGGISLLLDAVQVNDPQYGGDGLDDDFGPAAVVDDLPVSEMANANSATAGTGAAEGGF